MRHFLSINTLWFSNSSPESEWIRWNRKEVNITVFFQLNEQNNYPSKEVSHSPTFHNLEYADYTHELENEFIFEK